MTFEEWLHHFALKMYGNAYVFDDTSVKSGLTSRGDDLEAAWQAATLAERERCEAIA